uniref:collectin-11-like n=1 Tax=Styela clava TaxID=7725 RepID=UPI001939F7DD|nr:collectin-11-like [Styela clava]
MSLLATFILTFLCVVECCAQEHRSNISFATRSPEIEPGSGDSDNDVSLSSEIENVTSTKIDQRDIRIKALEQKLKEIEREKVKKCSPTSFLDTWDMASLIMEKARETAINVPNDSQCQTTCRPGKKGPEGAKGDIGPKGQNGATGRQGAKGESGTPCNCSRYDELARKFQILEEEKARELQPVEDGWYRVHSYPYWYKLVNVSSDYQTARKYCEIMGGQLATNGIRNPTIRSDLLDKFIRSSGKSIWIGLDDLEKPDNWKWSDGISSTSSNTPWGEGEPNYSHERCACMYIHLQYQIADLSCTYKQFYLCEK